MVPTLTRSLVERALAHRANAAEPIARWVELVADWNQRIDLTAARSDEELVDLMVADSTLLAAELARDQRVVDVGSGAGAPGLPLALMRSDLHVTLVEPMQKRAALLRLVKGQNPTAKLAVFQGRGEAIRGRFDVAISRATLPPAEWLELGTRLADEVWVMLAAQEPPERPGWTIVKDRPYTWPLTGAARRAVAYRAAG